MSGSILVPTTLPTLFKKSRNDYGEASRLATAAGSNPVEAHKALGSSTLPLSADRLLLLECRDCGYESLDVHRTNGSLITYCQRCGASHKEKREPERRQWTESERELHRKRMAFLKKLRKAQSQSPRR